jgi:hypothetical protein
MKDAQNRFINEDIFVARKGDFLIDGTYTFGAKIPLWLFGFLY